MMGIQKIDTTNLLIKMNGVMDKFGDILKQEMIIRAPNEYGDMVASIEKDEIKPITKNSKGSITVGTHGIPYAAYVEFGTGNMVRAHGPHVAWAPVRDWEALEKRGEVGLGQTMPFATSANFFTENDRMALLKEAFHR